MSNRLRAGGTVHASIVIHATIVDGVANLHTQQLGCALRLLRLGNPELIKLALQLSDAASSKLRNLGNCILPIDDVRQNPGFHLPLRPGGPR
eukprot:CAMPEP_0115547578 /NCGR_PEP_ID=MMETSP0271-20121206/93717_1 /TAXON_ID=71861 /ORGANISM="Scrippsiella trochoidea, Strain CCMP3099" /LENGTH=91 /DNA_ID=CAMNT_0002981011 /DNA_START=66 /DNA_END=342 /DNA_ORIENTATION=-